MFRADCLHVDKNGTNEEQSSQDICPPNQSCHLTCEEQGMVFIHVDFGEQAIYYLQPQYV